MPRLDRSLLDDLRQTPRLAELAAHPFDFDLRRAEHGEAVRLASGASLEGIAGDDSGGTYFLCGGGGVLYADSEGQAGLIAESLADALELVAGLPGWRDHLYLPPALGADQLRAAALEVEDGMRASNAPELDARRDELLAGLGLAVRSRAELFARMHRALLRSEPDHLLLLADEGHAYALLDPHPRPPLMETVLAHCRADLARLRADPSAWPESAFSPVSGGSDPEHDANSGRRAGVLRALQYDRHDADLPLLRHLLEQETLCRRAAAFGGMGEELHLAVFLVARHLRAEDLPRLHAARCANFDTWCALSDLPLGGPGQSEEDLRWEPEGLRAWADTHDTSECFGGDPRSEPPETWVTLARGQGRTELARTALIRLLDDVGPSDTAELPWIAAEFVALADFQQASRAQRLYAKLQDTGLARASAYSRLSALERQAGDLDGAWTSLEHVLTVLDGPRDVEPGPSQPVLFEVEPAAVVDDWRDKGVALALTEEHFLLARSAADSGRPDLAHRALLAGTALLDTLDRASTALYGAAHAAARACGDGELSARYEYLLAEEEQRLAEFPYDLDDDDD
ncbi:hypothetical protein ABT124_12940 [Streptomyces sp. NPDC001982]|uniref:hypothetical protein n=1 Tax=Streptomyces sp. NPDC001982 TaxID=3154405 RepID=UPI00332D5289